MNKVEVKLNDGSIGVYNLPFRIGDYVKIVRSGCQYDSYQGVFKYFWGDEHKHARITREDEEKDIWKVINVVLHCYGGNGLIYHIRSCDGRNVAIGGDGLRMIKYHKRNRNTVHQMRIFQLPTNDEIIVPHKWTDKLYEFIVK